VIVQSAFRVEPWCVRETQLRLDLLAQSESVFALSNGHIGLRGNLDEGEPHGTPGTYLNSFYELRPLPYPEVGYGDPESGQTIVNVTNGKLFRLLVDDEPFNVRYGELRSHERRLDFRAGVLERTVDWVSPAGRAVRIRSTRLVSFTQRAVAAIRYEVAPLDRRARITVQSELVANETLPEIHGDPRASAALDSPLLSEAMHFPYDDELGVHPQAEGFTLLDDLDFASISAGRYPLLFHIPYCDLYRKQVVKQADLVLAMHWRGDAFTPEQKARNFAYYEQRTVRDSSLSACTQAVLAAEVGHVELAYDYVGEAALMDLRDVEQNTRDGVHMASLAGSWIALVCGLGGMRDHDGQLSFAPRLPSRLERLQFSLLWRGHRLRVTIGRSEATYSIRDGRGTVVDLLHYGEPITVSVGDLVRRPIPPGRPLTPPPLQPPGRAPVRRTVGGTGAQNRASAAG
jgi:trehalose/maltose hydrolase-like predicted phosphorylase